MKKLSKVKKYGAGGPASLPVRGNLGITKNMANDFAYSAIGNVQDAEAAKQQSYDNKLNSMFSSAKSLMGTKYFTGGVDRSCPEGYYRDFNTNQCVAFGSNAITPASQISTNITIPDTQMGGSYFGRYEPTLQEKVMQSATNSLNNPTTQAPPQSGGINPSVYGIAGQAAGYLVRKGTDDKNEAVVTDKERFGNMAGSVLESAGKGAALGSMFGPYGTAIGAVGGAVFGVVQGKKENKEAKKTAARIQEDSLIAGNLNREAMLANSMPNQTGFGYKSSTNMNMQPTNYFSGKTGGVRKVEGGVIKQIPGTDAVKFIGRSHAQGGIKVDPKTEVEGGETQDQVYMKNNAKQDYIYSKYLKLGGKSFAKRHEEILKSNMPAVQKQNAMQDLAKMQEQKAGRDPQQIAKTGGVRRYLNGGPQDCGPDEAWSEAEQRCVPGPMVRDLSTTEQRTSGYYWPRRNNTWLDTRLGDPEYTMNSGDWNEEDYNKVYEGRDKGKYVRFEPRLPNNVTGDLNEGSTEVGPADKYRIFQNAEGDYILRDADNNEITRSKDLNTVYQAKGRLVNKGFFQNKDNTITEPTKVETVADLNTPIDQQIVSQDPNTGVYSITDKSGNEVFSSGDINDVLTYNRDQAAKNTPSEQPVQSKIQNDTVDIDFSKFTAEKAAEELNKVYNVDNGGVVPADVIEAYTNYYSSQEEQPASNTTNTNTIPTVADLNTPLTSQGSADAQSNADAVDVTLRDENKANSNAPSDQTVVTEGSDSNASGVNAMQQDRPKRDNEPTYFMGAKRKIDDLGNVAVGNQLLQGHGALIGSGLGTTGETIEERQKNIIGTAVERKQENDYVNKSEKVGGLSSSNAIKDREKIAQTDWGKYFGYKPGMSKDDARKAHDNYATQANELFTKDPDLVLSYFQYMLDNATTGSEAEQIKNYLKGKGHITTEKNGRAVINRSALKILQEQATNDEVGPIHNSMAYLTSTERKDAIPIATYTPPEEPQPEEQPEKRYTPPSDCPPNSYRNPTTGRCEPLSPYQAQERFTGIIPQLAQLVPVGYSLLNPYQIQSGIGAVGSAARTVLPRVNYNQERASLIDQNVALKNAVVNQNAGPGTIAALMAAGSKAGADQLKIAQAESEANKGLAAEEAKLNLQSTLANMEMGMKREMFNKEFANKQRNYKREEILGALDAAAERTAGIYKDNKLFAAQERLAKALDETGSYDRFTIFEELKKQSKSPDSPYYGKTDVELRAIAAEYASSIYGDLDYYKYLADKEGGKKEKEEAKLGGARKYTSRLGELSGGRKRFNI
jgi:hypothetical protein